MRTHLSELTLDPFPGPLELWVIAGVYQRSLEPEIRGSLQTREYVWGLRGRGRIGLCWSATVAEVFARAALPGTVRVAERLEFLASRAGSDLMIYRRRVTRVLWLPKTPVEMQLKKQVALEDFEVSSETRAFVCLKIGKDHIWFPKSDAAVLQSWLEGA